MTTSEEVGRDVPEADCFRSLVRRPPHDETTTEYLAWARLMAQVVDDLSRWAPNFAVAVASSYRSLDGLRPYCESGEYENAYTEPLAHAVNFVRHFVAQEHPAWLKDLARCEMWSSPMAQNLDDAERKAVKEALGIQERGGKEFVIVGHDVLETLQHVTGYRDMTFVRSAPLMWLLRVPPLDVTPSPEPRPGVVVFRRHDDSVSMSYVPAGGRAVIGGVSIGVAVEAACDQYARGETSGGWVTDFVEYGVHTAAGVPDWVVETRRALGSGLTLHPLDMNMAQPEQGAGPWVESLASLVREHEVTALVSDAGFWYLDRRRGTWFRPPDMNLAASRCGESAAAIAAACGVPFRVENPPLEWLPNSPCLWSFLDEASDHEGVQICLDLSHVLQFERNVHGRSPVLPRSFPWERVAEIHLAGYVRAEYGGRPVYLDQHLADIPAEEYRLLAQVVELRGTETPLGICLEMEPREPGAFVAAVDNIHTAIGAVA